MTVLLPVPLGDRILAHAWVSSPEECCGILVGEIEQGKVRVHEVLPARNVADDPRRRFSIDVEDLFAVHRSAREEGREVVGYYHSHPEGPSRPSATDEKDSFPGSRHLIVGLGEGEPSLRSWRFDPAPREERIQPW